MILSKTRSDRRDRRLCRFGVMLVICSLLVNMVCVPKAKAVVIDATAAFGAAAATAAINGTTATTLFTGMSTSAATTAMTTLMGEYAASTGAAASGAALAGMIGAGTIVTAAGALVLTAAAGYAVYKFIEWLREDKGLEAGGSSFSAVRDSGYFNGNVKYFVFDSHYNLLSDGDLFAFDSSVIFGDHTAYCDVSYSNGSTFLIYSVDNASTSSSYIGTSKLLSWGLGYFMGRSTNLSYGYVMLMEDGSYTNLRGASTVAVGDGLACVDFGLDMEPLDDFVDIPSEIEEGHVLKINTGLEGLPADDPQAIADTIMQTAIDGALDPVVTVEADPTVTPDPDPDPDGSTEVEPDPDAPELPSNLGDLGAALTTRFPFSIPWDIARAIKLIAAPAKAPYWEVDFLAPIAYRLPEGWKGSTKIVLDFGQPEYEIIGIASRWTSTIGFCLALAAATKRFIWTA